MANVWFSDCEVFAKDLLWVFKSKRTGQIRWFHNDTAGVEAFIESIPDLWLCGYNFRDYDQYILKGTLLHWDNDQLKELNDTLIFDSLQDAWELFGYETVYVPPIIDLFHDIVPRKSLKEIEANMGMDIQETEVSFDLDRALTPDEFELTLKYCIHDVEATEQLYYKRLDYIKTKRNLCQLADLDDSAMMKNTNARVVAEALHAQKTDPIERFGVERYVDIAPVEIMDVEHLPKGVWDYVQDIDSLSGWDTEKGNLLFDCYGTPAVMGLGGLHASTGQLVTKVLKGGPRKGQSETIAQYTPKAFRSDETATVFIADVGSYYPSLMINFDYMSRAIPTEDRGLYEEFYHMRMAAKAKGDKATADAAKLVLNTKYGCMKNRYNKLFDPFHATCVCVTGQLLLLELIGRIKRAHPTAELVQANTDGIVIKADTVDMESIGAIIDGWCDDTGFTMEIDEIDTLIQRDVNNYICKFKTGKVKAKGGAVKNWQGGDFKSNSCTIVDRAIVRNLLEGVPIADVIAEESNLEPFQIVLKAGGGYNGCVRKNVQSDEYEPIQGKVHRVYACDEGATFYKCKDGVNPAKFPDAPAKAKEYFEIKGIDEIDRDWYTALATKKMLAFVGRSAK